jgi:hypothetical protein
LRLTPQRRTLAFLKLSAKRLGGYGANFGPTVGLGGRIFHRQPVTRPHPRIKRPLIAEAYHEAAVNLPTLCKLEKGASYPGLEIIAKPATVLEVEPAELLRVSGWPNT